MHTLIWTLDKARYKIIVSFADFKRVKGNVERGFWIGVFILFHFILFCQTKKKSSVRHLSNYKNDIINRITILSHTKQKDRFYTLYWDETNAFPRLKHIDHNKSQIKDYKKMKKDYQQTNPCTTKNVHHVFKNKTLHKIRQMINNFLSKISVKVLRICI